ncbi:hypothetical protein Pfo_025820 [Paulownia fortunei]|nr:hypothetical protein Pfo_025820 [Paulownia fortunei]
MGTRKHVTSNSGDGASDTVENSTVGVRNIFAMVPLTRSTTERLMQENMLIREGTEMSDICMKESNGSGQERARLMLVWACLDGKFATLVHSKNLDANPHNVSRAFGCCQKSYRLSFIRYLLFGTSDSPGMIEDIQAETVNNGGNRRVAFPMGARGSGGGAIKTIEDSMVGVETMRLVVVAVVQWRRSRTGDIKDGAVDNEGNECGRGSGGGAEKMIKNNAVGSRKHE